MNKYSALFLSLGLLLAGCQQQQQKTSAGRKAGEEALAPLHIGAVHQVYPEQGFALLRIIGPMPKTGSTLITHPADGSNDRLGNLCISSQKPTRDRIIAADIRSGTILKGDRVFLYRNIGQQDGEEEEITVIDAPEGETAPATPAPDAGGQSAADAPLPEPGPDAGLETTVLPTTPAPKPDTGKAPATPHKAPDYINDIPDNINDWD